MSVAKNPDVPNYEEMGYIGYKGSIKKIKEIKKFRKNIKTLDILHCILVTMNIVCALYIVSNNLCDFARTCGKTVKW